VPSVADLRARRLELTREALASRMLADDDLDRFRGIVESLGDGFDLMELTLAAVALAHDAVVGSDDDDTELPEIRLHGTGGGGSGASKRGPAPKRSGSGQRDGGHGRRPGPTDGMARLYIGAGQKQGIRPKDLVGAIANESGLSGREVGSIEITPNFSLVEVPRAAVDDVMRALRGTTIKGRRATVRPDRHVPS